MNHRRQHHQALRHARRRKTISKSEHLRNVRRLLVVIGLNDLAEELGMPKPLPNTEKHLEALISRYHDEFFGRN